MKGGIHMLRIIIKILLFPAVILLGIFEWLCSAAAGLSGMAFRMIAGVFILTAILSYGFGLEPWSVAMRMTIGGAVFLMIPMVGTILVAGITLLRAFIRTI